MENSFKRLASEEEVPKELKAKVLASVNTTKLFLDVAELFTEKYVGTIGQLLKRGKDKNNP